jgi:DHA1 family tetracycline resistance protein-like MFS transporter
MPFIMATVLIDMISIGIIIPVLPALVGSFTGSQAHQALWYGAVTFAFSFANFFGSPFLGALSDSYGRRPVLLLGFLGLAFNFILTGLSTAIWMLIAVRLVGGAMMANQTVAHAYVADITPPAERARRFGALGAMFGVGFILGPVIGGLLGAINLQLPFLVAGGLALLNVAYGYFVLPESLPKDRRHPFEWKSANPFRSLRALAELKGVGALVVVVAFNGLAQFTLYTTWVLYTTFKYGWGPLENGWSLAASGVIAVIVQGLLMPRLLRRFTPRRLAVIGLLSSTIAYFLYGAAPEGWMMFAIIAANLFGVTVMPAIQGIVSSAAGATTQGKSLGALSGINSMMALLAPIIGAPLIGVVSHLPQGDWRIGAPFYFCALLSAVSLWLAVAHFRRERHQPPGPAVKVAAE